MAGATLETALVVFKSLAKHTAGQTHRCEKRREDSAVPLKAWCAQIAHQSRGQRESTAPRHQNPSLFSVTIRCWSKCIMGGVYGTTPTPPLSVKQ